MEPAARQLGTSPRHDKLRQQDSKFYAICACVSIRGGLRPLHVSALVPDTARTLSSAVPTALHRPRALRAYQTEKGLYCL